MATWNIIKTIAEGGFGKVYEVRSTEGKKGALKELKNINVERKKRFEREIKILQNLKHPHIIDIFEWNINGSPPLVGPYFIMEYMEGGTLRNCMYNMFNVRKGLFAQKWTLGVIIFPIIDALQLAHANFTYHRDLKPDNLLFTNSQQNSIKIVDWGIGKDINRESIGLTVGGIGTPGYCAPEQWFANDIINGTVDIYSLGIIFYEMMTGKLPQVYDNTGRQFTVPPPSQKHPSISTQLDNIILNMIAYDPKRRYQTVKDLKNALLPIYQAMK